jgi:hypothetical protein
MPYIQFDDKQCKSFILDSKTHYKNPETTSLEIIKWKFMGYVSHPSYHLFIRDSEGLKNSGRAALNFRTLNLRDNYRKVTQITDLLAIKSKNGLMTFIELIRQYRSLGSDAVLHTSNENSEKIYSNFFKFKEVFQLSAFAFPIRPQKLILFLKRNVFLAKVVGVYSLALFMLMRCIKSINPISLSDGFSSENLNILLRDFGSREVSLLRSEEFLNWRYLDAPYAYKTYTINLCKKPIGILVSRLTQFKGAHFFLVMDCINSAPIKRWKGFCFRLALISEAIALNADAIFGLFNRNNKDLATFFHLPFIAVDDKMLPHRSPIFVSSAVPSLKIEEFKEMYFSLGDLDYF